MLHRRAVRQRRRETAFLNRRGNERKDRQLPHHAVVGRREHTRQPDAEHQGQHLLCTVAQGTPKQSARSFFFERRLCHIFDFAPRDGVAHFSSVLGTAAPIVRQPGGRVHRREDVVLQSYKKLANRHLTPAQFHRARIHDIPRDAKGVSLCADYSVTLPTNKNSLL